MKYIVVFICCFVQVFSATVPGNATEEVCSALPKNETCCETEGCKLFSCGNATEGANNTIEDCHLASWKGDAKCKENTTKEICSAAANTTTVTPATKASTGSASTTTPTTPTDNCTKATDQASCCSVDGCIYTNCTSTDASVETQVEKCGNNETVAKVCKPGTNTDQCPVVPDPSKDDCEQYNQTTCCSHQDQKCRYINCTGKEDKPYEGCHVNSNDTSGYCKGDIQDQCNPATPSPTVNPATGSTSTAKTNTSTTTQSSDANASKGSGDSGQKFDGASFIGGIVLCAGLVAIIFFGLKFYKSRTERNYHTL